MGTVLITGASYGIGADFARLFASGHHNLILVARDLEKLTTLKDELIKKYLIEVDLIACDLSVSGAAYTLVDQLKKGEQINVLVNNAGIGDYGLFHELNPLKQQQMIELNITNLTLLTQLLLPAMVKLRSGKILNVASTAAFQPGPLMAVYYASKAYVLSFSVALANELKGKGVTVTALCPGPTSTHFVENANLQGSKLFKQRKPANAKSVALYGIKAMNRGDVIAIEGTMNKVMAFVIRFFPITWQAAMVRMVQEKG
jgi:uncharacterized protein